MSHNRRFIAGLALLCSLLLACDSAPRKAEQAYQAGLVAKNRGAAAEALQQFRRARALNPQQGNAYLEIGGLLCQERQYGAAVKHLLRALEYGAAAAQANASLGYAYEQLGHRQLAEQFYREALVLAPKAAELRLRLADLLEAQDRWREAADVLQAALTLTTDRANEAFLKARVALLRQPQSPETYLALADLYISNGDIPKGLAAYRKAAPLDPQAPDTLAQFGLFCAERRQWQTAAAYLQKALALGVSNPSAVRAVLGSVYAESGQTPEAITEYQAVLKIQPDAPEIRLKLADLLEQAKQFAEAANVLEGIFVRHSAAEAAQLPALSDVNALWGRILRLRGEDSKKAVVRLNPSDKFNLIAVVVNETVPATMIIDPRAEYAIISEELAQQLNILLSAQTSEVRFEFAGTPYTAPLINLPSLKIGKLEVRNIPALLWDFSQYPGIDGVVGMTFLKHFQVEIKTDEQLVILTKLSS